MNYTRELWKIQDRLRDIRDNQEVCVDGEECLCNQITEIIKVLNK